MKLSNKILIGFFGFLFLYLTAAFAELRIAGTPNLVDDKNSIAETVDITGVAYIVINNVDKQIKVIGSDRAPALEVRSLSGDLLTRLKYKVSGDTLTLSGIQSDGAQTVKVSIFVPKTSLKGITVNSSVAIVDGLRLPVLNISQKSGSIWMTDSQITKIEMDLDKSYIDITGANVDTVSAKIERSHVNIFAPVILLQGSMKHKSFLRLHDAQEIQLKKDASSGLNIYE